MNAITRPELKKLAEIHQDSCVSLYVPTHPGGSEQDPIRWKNLIQKAADQLERRGWKAPRIRDFLATPRALLEQAAYWKNLGAGLAYFLSSAGPHSFLGKIPFPETVVVGSRFHLKPLFPLTWNEGRFYVLAISPKHIRLYRGDADSLHEVDLRGMPTNLAEALKFHDRDEPLTFHTRRTTAGTWSAIFSGHGVGIDDYKDDLLLYFRKIDQGLHEFLRNEKAPLVLGGVEYLQPIYHEANSYSHLVERGIAGNVEHFTPKELHEGALAIVRPDLHEPAKKAAALYERLLGTGRTCRETAEVLGAVAQGRLETLFVAGDQTLWGSAEPGPHPHDKMEKGDEDLLNWAACKTFLAGGTVHVLPAANVPGDNLLAGIYWLPLTKIR